MTRSDMGRMVKLIRFFSGDTQKAFAKKADMSVATLSALEKGARSATLLDISNLAAIAGIPVTALFYAYSRILSGGDDSPPKHRFAKWIDNQLDREKHKIQAN